MLAKIKLALIAAATIGMSILYALFQTEKRKRAEDQAKADRLARETERLGAEAMIGGLENEKEVRDEKVDTNHRDHFTR